MPSVQATNMGSQALLNLEKVAHRLGGSVKKLSSGLRINSAADDAAGLAIRELMRRDIAGLNQGIRNASDGISMLQTADGAMAVIDEKLVRMKELAEQAATGSYTTAQREMMDQEYQLMAREIDRIAAGTEFNGIKLLNGQAGGLHQGSGLKVHFGIGNDADQDYYYASLADMRASSGTGLRLGNTDTRDTWATTGLDMADGNATFGDTGVFGIQHSTDGGATWQTYGWVSVDGDDTLGGVVEEINRGPAWQATLQFGGATTANLHGQDLTINGNVFTFDSSLTAGASTANSIGINGLASSVAIANAVAEYLNADYSGGDSAVDAFAAATAATNSVLRLYQERLGQPGNDTALGSSAGAGVVDAGAWDQGQGRAVEARAVLQDGQGYELLIRSANAGQASQVRIITPDGNAIDLAGSSATLTAGGASLPLAGGAFVDGLAGLDQAAQWDQTVQGQGNTAWEGADILTQSAAQEALVAITTAMSKKDLARSQIGALESRLNNTITNLRIQAESLQAAESRISDVDVAEEMTVFTRQNIVVQAAVSMLAQANTANHLAEALLP